VLGECVKFTGGLSFHLRSPIKWGWIFRQSIQMSRTGSRSKWTRWTSCG
jgi:hypothetical protein